MKKILVVCTGNSCRSVLSEAFLNHLASDRLVAYSAGSHPLGKINAGALATLKRHGLPTDGYQSQSWDEFSEHQIDIVITVCDNAAGESCPVYFNDAARAHWGLSDPGHMQGSDEEVINAFEKTVEIIQRRIGLFLQLPFEQMDKTELQLQLEQIGNTV